MAFSIAISTQEYFKIRGRLEKIVKNAGHVVGMPLDNFIFKTSTQKETVQKTNANIKWPYTTKWDSTLIANIATGVEDFHFLEQIQTIIKPCFTLGSVFF